MKIPQKIQKLLDRRERLAMELMAACATLDSWLEENGADLTLRIVCRPTINFNLEENIVNEKY